MLDEEPAYVKIRKSLKPTPPKVEIFERHDPKWAPLKPTRPASGGEWSVIKIQAIWRGFKVRTIGMDRKNYRKYKIYGSKKDWKVAKSVPTEYSPASQV